MKIQMNATPSQTDKFYSEALPMGNGKTSAMLAGNVGTERLWVNYYTLWEGKQEDALPDVSADFKKIREKIEGREFDGMTEQLSDILRKNGYDCQLAQLGAPKEPSLIKMNFEAKDSCKQYCRGIDIEKGEAFVSYISENTSFRRTAFVSFADDAVIFKATSGVTFNVNLYIPSGINVDITVSDGGYMKATDKCTVIKDATSFLLKISYGKIPAGSYEELLSRHLTAYRNTLGKTNLTFGENRDRFNEQLIEEAFRNEISAELCEKLWHYGRYIFVSGTSEDTYPFPLYGLWTGKAGAVFSQHVANENVEMIYWHTAVGGLFRNTKALIHYYYRMIPQCQEAAMKLFGCRGIFVSGYTSPVNSLPAPNCGVIIHYIGAAAWLCHHFYEYYLYTKDEALFEKEILPFMILTAEFFEDYILYDKDGNVIISPSVSPENTPENLLPEFVINDRSCEGHFNVVVRNATMDFALLKELLTSLLEISEENSLPRDKVNVWRQILKVTSKNSVIPSDFPIFAFFSAAHPKIVDRMCRFADFPGG